MRDKRTPEYHKAGVYMIRNLITGDSYIGATCNLTLRLKTHFATAMGTSGAGSYAICKAFKGCSEEDIELRVIERIQVPTSERQSSYPASGLRAKIGPGLIQLWEREKFWIQKLKPSLNRKSTGKEIDVLKLPHGPPVGFQSSTKKAATK